MGYAVQDEEKIELHSSLAAEVITSVIIWFMYHYRGRKVSTIP
jgi:hypothetical protein